MGFFGDAFVKGIIHYSLLQNFIYYPISFPPMKGERIQVRNFEEVRSLLKSEKDPVVKQKLSFLVVAGEDCLYFERAVCKRPVSILQLATHG